MSLWAQPLPRHDLSLCSTEQCRANDYLVRGGIADAIGGVLADVVATYAAGSDPAAGASSCGIASVDVQNQGIASAEALSKNDDSADECHQTALKLFCPEGTRLPNKTE